MFYLIIYVRKQKKKKYLYLMRLLTIFISKTLIVNIL